MKPHNTLTSLFTLSLLLVVGCAKEKPFDTVYREVKELNRNQIVTEETVTLEDGTQVTKPVEYVYVPMTLGTPMNVTDADPFYQGQEKLVRLDWSEQGLEVLEIERDERFSDNDLNEYPVLTLPGEFKSYRCVEDAYGECTNREEINSELEWYQNTHFTPNFEDLKLREVNELDIFTLNNGSCLSEGDAKVVNYEISPGVINVELEKNYKVNDGNFFCFLMSFFKDQLNTNGFRVRHFYSLVRLDKLASPNYKPVEYPEPDHDSFGFFTREEHVLNDDFDRNRPEKKIFMARWNPDRPNKELVYHLSPEYSKPENDYILKATHDAINSMNREMQAANVPFTIKLVEQPDPAKAASPGDLRVNSLVLIEDPLANGLLGYGPSVTNPYTGEIIQAHTNMYLGVLKSMTRWVYSAAVDLTEKEFATANPNTPVQDGAIKVAPEALDNIPSPLALGHFPELIEANLPKPEPTPTPEPPANDSDDQDGDGQGDVANDDDDHQDGDDQGDVANNDDDQGENNDEPVSPEGDVNENEGNGHGPHAGDLHHKISTISNRQLSRVSMERIHHQMKARLTAKEDMKAAYVLKRLKEEGTLTKEQEIMLKEQARLDRYAENNAFAVEFFPIGGTTKVVYPALMKIPGILTEKGTLKRYDKLTQEQKDAAQKIIVANAYRTTLIHELGHNLGLRHNFMGSWDKENFYTEEEAQQRGLNAAPAYSSIMDYGHSEFNELSIFGKYDLAALRFGYAREVELNNGQFVKVDEPLEQFTKKLGAGVELKSYEFCTDENAGLSSICNRFDEGTSLVEVAKHLIERYEDYYKYRNYRDGRLDFSAYDLPGYLFARKREFTRIRDLLEEFEFFVGIFGKDTMVAGCSPQQVQQFPVCGMINDRRDAVKLVGDFFVDILQTPDHLCALADPQDPSTIVEYRKLGVIYDDIKFNLDYVPTSCFDEAVKEQLASGEQGAPVRQVIGETGKFFNGFKDTDPNYKYVTDRFVMGIWPDKVMAMDALFRRVWGKSNTDRGHMALMDHPEIAEKAQTAIEHLVLGKPMGDFKTFKTENGKEFKAPYAISNDYTINPIEDVFSWMREFLGMPSSGGSGNLIELTLAQTKKGLDYGDEYLEDSFKSRNLTAVKRERRYIPEGDRNPQEIYYYDAFSSTTYHADKYTKFASRMISALNNFEQLQKAGRLAALKVANHKANPQAPQTLPVPVQFFWSIPEGVQGQLITAAQNGAEFTEEQFTQFFGPAGAPLLQVYNQGPEFMQSIVAMKEQASNTPPANATEEEKAIFNLPVEIVQDFAEGTLTAEVLEFYKSQLRRLPNYLYTPWR